MELQDIDCRVKKIRGYNDYYITEYGDVYSKRLRGNEKEPHLHKLVPKNPGRADKYYGIVLCDESGEKTFLIHRLVAEHFCDGYFDGAVVNHKDGNNRNNRYDNLEWVTQKENIHHSYKTSGVDQYRNYKWWTLISPDGTELGTFLGHYNLEKFVKESGIDASPTSLSKYCHHNGYRVIKTDKQAKNCNDYPQGVHAG